MSHLGNLRLPARYADLPGSSLDADLLLYGAPRGAVHVKEDLRRFCEKLDIDYDFLHEGMVTVQFLDTTEYGDNLPEALLLLSSSLWDLYPEMSERIREHVTTFHATSLGIVEEAVSDIVTPFTAEDFLYGEDGAQVDMIDPEQVLHFGRIYRSAEGPMVDDSSKYTQQTVFDESDVSRKFDFPVDGPVLVAGAGDYTGRTHLAFDDPVLLDPRLNGVSLGPDTDLSPYMTLVSDCAGASEYGLEDMTYLNHVYETLHDKFPAVRKLLKLNVCRLPKLPLKLLKKPRPHNLEVICEVDDKLDVENGWASEVRKSIVRANWKRNRRIRKGSYPTPDVPRDRVAYYYAKAKGTYYKQQRVSLMPTMASKARPIRKCDYRNRLLSSAPGKPLTAISHRFLLFLKKASKETDMINLNEYNEFYDHPTADHAVETAEMAALTFRCTRNLDTFIIHDRERFIRDLDNMLAELLSN